MSHPAISIGDRFGVSTKREVGGCTWRVQTAWPCLGLALKSIWLELGGSPLLHEWAEKTVLSPCGASILALKLFSQSRRAVVDQEP